MTPARLSCLELCVRREHLVDLRGGAGQSRTKPVGELRIGLLQVRAQDGTLSIMPGYCATCATYQGDDGDEEEAFDGRPAPVAGRGKSPMQMHVHEQHAGPWRKRNTHLWCAWPEGSRFRGLSSLLATDTKKAMPAGRTEQGLTTGSRAANAGAHSTLTCQPLAACSQHPQHCCFPSGSSASTQQLTSPGMPQTPRCTPPPGAAWRSTGHAGTSAVATGAGAGSREQVGQRVAKPEQARQASAALRHTSLPAPLASLVLGPER